MTSPVSPTKSTFDSPSARDENLPPLSHLPPCNENWYKRVKSGKVQYDSSRTGGYRVLLVGMGLSYGIGDAILAKAMELLPSGPALKMSLGENQAIHQQLAELLHNDKKLGRYFQRQFSPKKEWKDANDFFLEAARRWLLVANHKKRKITKKAENEQKKRKEQRQHSSGSRISTPSISTDTISVSGDKNPRSRASSPLNFSSRSHSIKSSRTSTRVSKKNIRPNPVALSRPTARSNLRRSDGIARSRHLDTPTSDVSHEDARTAATEDTDMGGTDTENMASGNIEMDSIQPQSADVGVTHVQDPEPEDAYMGDPGNAGSGNTDSQNTGMEEAALYIGGHEEEEQKPVDLEEAEPEAVQAARKTPFPNMLELRKSGTDQFTTACLCDIFGTYGVPQPIEINLPTIRDRWNRYLKRRRLPEFTHDQIDFTFYTEDNQTIDVFDNGSFRLAYRHWMDLNDAHAPFVLFAVDEASIP